MKTLNSEEVLLGDFVSENSVGTSAILLDLSKIFYFLDGRDTDMFNTMKKLNDYFSKSSIPVFGFLRNELMRNEYLILTHKLMIFSGSSVSEEKFSCFNDSVPVSIFCKSSSGKFEIDDRFEFNVLIGFMAAVKKADPVVTTQVPVSTFNLDYSKTRNNENNAMILVEDSDRDSENELEADSDF